MHPAMCRSWQRLWRTWFGYVDESLGRDKKTLDIWWRCGLTCVLVPANSRSEDRRAGQPKAEMWHGHSFTLSWSDNGHRIAGGQRRGGGGARTSPPSLPESQPCPTAPKHVRSTVCILAWTPCRRGAWCATIDIRNAPREPSRKVNLGVTPISYCSYHALAFNRRW